MTAQPETRYPGPTITSRIRWLLRAHPADYLLAASVAAASLPKVGKSLEPLGGITALAIWGVRYMPDVLASTTKAWFTPGMAATRRHERDQAHAVSEAALRGIVPAHDLAADWPAPELTAPILKAPRHLRRLYRGSVPYGPSRTQVLDVWRLQDLPSTPAPVMIFVPGGAWVQGSRRLQGYALMSHLVELGWVCLSVEYRVAPHHRWPRQIQDVKAAIAWARAHVDQFGGDREFVAISGCSAGGHLATLAGLTRNAPEFQTELPEGADTSVDAVVGIYGRYDWEDKSTTERARFVDFLERVVVKRRITRHPNVFRDASPIARVHRGAPPFLVIHGTGDTLIPVAQARDFVDRMRGASRSVVSYMEYPGAGHAFDMTDGARTGSMATAVGLFLNEIHRRHGIGSQTAV